MNWGHASAHQLGRVLVDLEENNAHFLTCADEVLAQREVGQAFEKAPHARVAGNAIAAACTEKSQADLLFLGDMDVLSKFPWMPSLNIHC